MKEKPFLPDPWDTFECSSQSLLPIAVALTLRASPYAGPGLVFEKKATLYLLPLVFSLKHDFSCIRLLNKYILPI